MAVEGAISSPVLLAAAVCACMIFRSAWSFCLRLAFEPVVLGAPLRSRAIKRPLLTSATTSPRAIN